MYTNNQLGVIHLQDSYTIMYALLAREIVSVGRFQPPRAA